MPSTECRVARSNEIWLLATTPDQKVEMTIEYRDLATEFRLNRSPVTEFEAPPQVRRLQPRTSGLEPSISYWPRSLGTGQ